MRSRSNVVTLAGVLVGACVLAASGRAQDPGDLWREVQEAFRSGNRLDIASMIADPAGEAQTVSRYFDVERALYWEGRDLPAAVFVAQRAIAYCLIRASLVAGENPAVSRQLEGAASRIAFNLASSTWPGWDEPGIRITPEQRELGWASARLAVRISEKLNVGPAGLGNGYWMLGAHELAAGAYEDATASFRRAALFGQGAADRGAELVSEGFMAITDLVAGRNTESARTRLGEIRATIEREVPDPEFWTVQFDAASRVFLGARE
jgi:hypothetical protein